VKPRVVHTSPETDPAPKHRSPSEPAAEGDGADEREASMGDRLSRAARYHSILLGRGAHHVRHGIHRIGKHRAVQGVARAIGNRWWPNAGRGEGVVGGERRWKLPFSVARRGAAAGAEGGTVAAVRSHGAPRLAWDFAVVTAAVAILLVLHHQFKRPHRSLGHRSVLAAAVEPRTDSASTTSSFKRHHDKEHADKEHTDGGHDLVAVADRPSDLSATSRDTTQNDPPATPPAQSEPGSNSSDFGSGDAKQGDAKLIVEKHDDVPTPGAVNPAASAHSDPGQSTLTDIGPAQTREASKPATVADAVAPSLADPPLIADSPATPTKPRHHHHSTDANAAASLDGSMPNLDAPSSGPADSTPKTVSASPDLSTEAKKNPDSAHPPGPNLGGLNDASTPKSADHPPAQTMPVAAGDSAPPNGISQTPKVDTDIFGALQDSPSEKHDSKGPDLGATSPVDKPVDGAPHKRHRRSAPSTTEGPAPEPIRTADQNPLNDPLVDSKPKMPDPGKPVDPKPAEKLDVSAPPHEHELKGPDAGLNPPGDQPPVGEPPKHRRHRKPPTPEGGTPDPLHANDPVPSGGPVPDTKPHEPDRIAPVPTPNPATPVSSPEPKKTDDWSAPSPSSNGPPAKNAPEEPKADHGSDKPTPAAEHDLLGTLKDDHAEKHEPAPKGPDSGIATPGADSPSPGAEPPKHRRRKKSPEAESPVPAPAPASVPSPSIEPSPVPKAAETAAPILSDAPKTETKPSEPPPKETKSAEPPGFGGPAPIGNAPPLKPEPKPEAQPTPSSPPAKMPAIGGALPASADEQANVSFSRSLPEKAESGNLLTYKIVVRNNGAKLLKLVDIDEAVPADHTVHTTEPAAEVHDQTLHWAVRDLAPHEATTISITLAAPPAQPIVPAVAPPKPERPEEDQFKTSKADETAGSPHLELELIAPTALRTGESCRVGFRATNLGSKTAGLKLNLDLPSQLHFGRGQKLQYKVGELDGHESREDYLTAVASAPGLVEIHGSILLDGRTVASAKAVCRIEGAPASKQAALPRRDRFVVPASASESQTASAAPCNCGP
jgi:Domain of unknown function DUF11